MTVGNTTSSVNNAPMVQRAAGATMLRVIAEFPKALDAVRRVLDKNDGKKAEKPWADQDPAHHLRHGMEHTVEAWDDPEAIDEETDEPAVAHAVTRLLMYLELLERRKEDVE